MTNQRKHRWIPLTDDDIHRLTGVYLRWWRFSDVDTRKAFKELLDEVQRLRGPCWEPDRSGFTSAGNSQIQEVNLPMK